MSEGHASAQRINQSMTGDPLLMHRVDASQLQAPVHVAQGRIEELPDYDDEEAPFTRMEFGALLLLGVVSWGLFGALIYGVIKLVEVLR